MRSRTNAKCAALLLSVTLTIVLIPAKSSAEDFRAAEWGITLVDVISLHPEVVPADRRIGYIAYDEKLAGLDVKVFYRFDEEGLLFEAGYEVLTEEDDGDGAIRAYQRLNELLRQRYPDSTAPAQTWRNSLFEDNQDQWGRAVRIGHMSYEWTHKVTRTTIKHTLSGSRREISHTLLYAATVEETEQNVLEQL